MPRAPKPCKDRIKEDESGKVKKVKGGISKMVEELVKTCSVWLEKGQGTACLPMEKIDKLSHEIWKMKMASWKDERCEDLEKDLGCMGLLDETLSQLFKALESCCCLSSSDVTHMTIGKTKTSKTQASTKLQNTSSGLVLAAMILDLSAFQSNRSSNSRPQVQPKEEVVANAMAFLWHQTRFALPALLESNERSGCEAAVDLCQGLARSLRCIHHVLAAWRYCSNALPAASLGHKAAPMAAQCATLAAMNSTTSPVVKTALVTLGEASSDLLISLSGYGCIDSSLQALAMTEFRRLATLNVMGKNGLIGAKGAASPSFLALALRAIGATMLPLGIYSKQSKDLCRMAVERVTAADARAGHLAAVVVQQMLAATGSDSISVLVEQLFAVVGDPFWASAPLYALRLIGALSRVAGASRAVDLECCQREEATKLLAKAAEALTRSAQEAAEGDDLSDKMKALKTWASEKVSILDAIPSEDGLWAPASSQKQRGDLQGSAFAASNARCNAAALLCLNLATPVVSKKRKDIGGAAPLKAKDWVLEAWASHKSGDLSVAERKAPSSKEIRSAIALHRQLQWKDPSSILSRARTSALECLLSLAGNNPLAHVRRQALCGLSACCKINPQLIASRCVAEAVAAGLQDEAALARLASVELVAQLKCPEGRGEGDLKSTIMPRLMELRSLVRGKLSDPSVLVRRGAFRAAGVWLEECEDGQLTQIHEAGEILRRLRSEQAQIRSQALSVLERVIFCKDGTKSQTQEAILQRLCTLHAHQGVGPAGVRDILAAHCKSIEGSGGADVATAEMEGLTMCALKSLPATSKMGALELYLSLLEQLSLERPAAFHKHLNRFAQWLEQPARQSIETALVLPIAACNILAQVLPNWAEQSASALSKQKMAEGLTQQLAQLLDEDSAPSSDLGQLARVVVKCLAAVAEHLSVEAREMLMGHFGRSFGVLSEATKDGITGDHRQLCRHTWIMASLLEFLDSKSLEVLCETIAQVSGPAAVTVLSKAAVALLSECCLRGPAAVKPAMIPALGFALRRFPKLLAAAPDSQSPLTVLKHGLACESSSMAANVLRLRTAEVFAGLASSYQEAAESDGVSKKRSKDNSASVGAQKLATLQPELLALLQTEEKTIQHALRGLRSLCDLGVLHPASTVPGILCVTVAGSQVAARHARQLLLRMVENAGAPLLAQRCGIALRMAAQQLGEVKEVKLYNQSWRYGPLCEAYGEFMDTKHARDQFLSNLISEVLTESEESSDTSVFLLRLQLVVGLLLRLPLSKEAEVARLAHSVVQFLTLKVAPYLTLDDQEKANKIDFPPPTHATCAVAVVLHKLCLGWLDVLGADFTKQMQDSWGSTFSLSMDFDQALPVAFTRQTLPNLTDLFEKIALEDGESLLNDIDANSPLLNSHAAARALAIKQQQSRKRPMKEEGKSSKLKRTRVSSKAIES